MASKAIYFVLLVVALGLVVDDAEAGWKFWKKKKDDDSTTTTTIAPGIAGEPQAGGAIPVVDGKKPSGVSTPAPAVSGKPVPSSTGVHGNSGKSVAPGAPSTGTRGAIAGAANPGLAIGVGNTGENIRNNARPQRPNPGTEVGLDIAGPRPMGRPGTGGNTGKGYRDWAADLTGAGEGSRQPPKLPSQDPALSPGSAGQPQPGIRPGSPTNPAIGGQQQPATRPGSPATPATGGQQQPGTRPTTPVAGGHQQPESRPGSPTNSNGKTPPPLGPRPGSPAGGLAPQHGGQANTGQIGKPVEPARPGKPNSQGFGNSDGTEISTLHVGPLNPSRQRPGSVSSGYGSPGSEPGSPTGGATPNGGKSYAAIAATGGNVKPISPTPAPRPDSVRPGQPIRPGQTANPSRPENIGNKAGQTNPDRKIGSGAGETYGPAGASAAAAVGIPASVTVPGGKIYYSNPSYSKGYSVTNLDLEKLSEALFIKDTNNANRYITLNLQKQKTSQDFEDQAPLPLLTVNDDALKIETIKSVLDLYKNYKLNTKETEQLSVPRRNQESTLIENFLKTNVMSAAMRFLADKNFVRRDHYEYKDILKRIWFSLYSRGDGKSGSSGFEHVFLTELKLGTEVSGLHNWIYYNNKEREGRINYLGYIKKVDLGDKAAIVKIQAKIHDINKPVTTMFIGTSPELEMALYTVCFMTRRDQSCPVSLGGTKFNIITHNFNYNRIDSIGSAYPQI